MDPFVHLRAASGYSLQHGASHPHVLVERAAEQEMDTLALTDRDGTYGAVKFARACQAAGIRPVLGVDLAYRPVADVARRSASRPRTPTRGGEFRDPAWDTLPRVTLLATADGPGGGRAGWAAICRLVSAVHLAGERGRPVATLDLLAPWLAGGSVMVLLGPGSEVGAAVSGRRDDLARAALAPWREVVPAGHLHLELVSHRLGRPGAGRHRRVGPRQCSPRRPDGRAGPPRGHRARCSPTPSATPTDATRRPSTSSTPPAGWSPSTGATSTAATPRVS